MEKKQLHYDAFISYRHNDLDKFVATNLHHLLETYKLPKSIIKNNNLEKTKIERVFRDQEELPLSNSLEDPIVKALENSDYLIVICSPRLKESIWCKKEIETFIKLHGRSRVLAVLVEGEPVDSFPKELLYDEKTKKEIEPLALDCRGNSKKEVLANLKKELLRLIAPMFNLNYDDLKRRHHERKVKNMIRLGIVSTIVLALFLVYATINLIIIKHEQNSILNLWSVKLAEESSNSLKADDREEAIKKAYQAITKYDGMKMPQTSEAIVSLTDALDVYDMGVTAKSAFNIDTRGTVTSAKAADDEKHMLIYDTSNTLTLIDNNYKVIHKYTDLNSNVGTSHYYYSFVNNKYVVYANDKNKTIVRDFKGKDIKHLKDSYRFINMSDYLVAGNTKSLVLYDKDFNEVYSYRAKDGYLLNDNKMISKKYLIFSEAADFTNSKADKNITRFIVVNIETKETMSFELRISIGLDYIINGTDFYILGNDYEMDVCVAHIYKYNLKNVEEQWHTKINNNYGDNFGMSSNGNRIYLATSNSGYLINSDNGDIVKNYSIGSSVVRLLTYNDSDDFLVICSDGSYYSLGASYKSAMMNPLLYHFEAESYTDIMLFDGEMVAIPENDNRVIVYQKRNNKKEEIKAFKYKNETYTDAEIAEEIKAYPSIKKELANNFVKVKSEGIIIFSFKDKTMEVYDLKSRTLLSEIKNVASVSQYVGKDKAGNLYFRGFSDGVVLNKDYEHIANIDHLVGLDKKNNKVILEYNQKYYKMPIYSVKELKKAAKDYLKKYNN